MDEDEEAEEDDAEEAEELEDEEEDEEDGLCLLLRMLFLRFMHRRAGRKMLWCHRGQNQHAAQSQNGTH